MTVKDADTGFEPLRLKTYLNILRFSKHNVGLGLRLPIAKAIVGAHGGQITVESVRGEDSLFIIGLPTEHMI